MSCSTNGNQSEVKDNKQTTYVKLGKVVSLASNHMLKALAAAEPLSCAASKFSLMTLQ